MVSGYLLDLNVVLAVIDENHLHHPVALDWFENTGSQQWFTCPFTEVGAVRVASSRSYPGGPWPAERVVKSIETLCDLGSHRFIPNDLGVRDNQLIVWPNMRSHHWVTDSYLLATAVAIGAHLATFDQSMQTSTVVGSHEHLLILG